MSREVVDPGVHVEVVTALSKPGEALAVGAPTSSLRNPEWFWPDGSPRDSRKLLHDRLLGEVWSRFPEVRQERRAVVLAGPPGAGKSTTLQRVLQEEVAGFVHVDADEFKSLLLHEAVADGSYESWLKPARVKELETQGERFFPLDLATLVHEESSKLAKRMRHLAIEKGANMVVDTVLGSQSSARQLVEGLVAAGYRVEIIDVEVPEAVSREAIRQRWRDGYETALTNPQGLGGRWVPSEYLREVFNGPDGRSWPEHNAETLARTTPEITRLRRYRGTTVTGERILELDLHRPTPDTTLTPRLTSLKQPSRTTHNHLQR